MSTFVDMTAEREACLRVVEDAAYLSAEQKAALADSIRSAPVTVTDRYLDVALNAMRESLDRAAIRDSWERRGLLYAAIFAMYGPEIILECEAERPMRGETTLDRWVSEKRDRAEHAEWMRARLSDIRAWLHEPYQAIFNSPTYHLVREDAFESVARVIDPERRGRRFPGVAEVD